MPQPVCAIVGAGEGLGRSLAAKFAGEGFDIALISRSENGSGAAADAAAGANAEANVKYFAADATQPETIERRSQESLVKWARWKSSSTTPGADSRDASRSR